MATSRTSRSRTTPSTKTTTSASTSSASRARVPDVAQDQARDGVCRGNTVWNISSYGNPAYGRHYSADGIYVDGGTRILIERNVSHHNDIGIELASEHGRPCDQQHVTLRDNFVYRNRIVGLFMGGYDALRGSCENCTVANNTFFPKRHEAGRQRRDRLPAFRDRQRDRAEYFRCRPAEPAGG